ncbi:MAG: glycosyltransferase family 4 protein [Opitutaceae bacterium]|nr:glycosyltransferase family 4 protein [Opitutaceae bacterium]
MIDTRRDILIATQSYVPDSAAVGQYLAEVAEGLAGRGWRVTVVAPERGYNEPEVRLTSEMGERGNPRIRRVKGPANRKGSLGDRLGGMIVFSIRAMLRALTQRSLDGMLVSSSPPILPLFMTAVARLRRLPLVYWVMDLNPDQATASGHVSASSWSARLLAASQRWVMSRAATVVVLDRFMEARVRRYLPCPRPLVTLPLWPLDVGPAGDDSRAFRSRHGLTERFVIMHSGNHSPVHPLDTLLDAARILGQDARFKFLFVGGGLAKAAIEEARTRENLENVLLLPSQPLGALSAVLGAADVHVVSMGENMAGCVHPSKVYNILSAGRPFVLLGPASCSLNDLLQRFGCGWRIAHGDTDGFVRLLQHLASPEGSMELERMRGAAGRVYETRIEAARGRMEFLDTVEDALGAGRS